MPRCGARWAAPWPPAGTGSRSSSATSPTTPPHRDGTEFPGIDLRLYRDLAELRGPLSAHLAGADVAMVTSFCPEGNALAPDGLRRPPPAARLLRPRHAGHAGQARRRRRRRLPAGAAGWATSTWCSATRAAARWTRCRRASARGARRPLYGSVDPDVHRPASPRDEFSADLSYLGHLRGRPAAGAGALLVEPARRAPDRRFVIGGAQYPADFPWTAEHLLRAPPARRRSPGVLCVVARSR